MSLVLCFHCGFASLQEQAWSVHSDRAAPVDSSTVKEWKQTGQPTTVNSSRARFTDHDSHVDEPACGNTVQDQRKSGSVKPGWKGFGFLIVGQSAAEELPVPPCSPASFLHSDQKP